MPVLLFLLKVLRARFFPRDTSDSLSDRLRDSALDTGIYSMRRVNLMIGALGRGIASVVLYNIVNILIFSLGDSKFFLGGGESLICALDHVKGYQRWLDLE